MSDVIIIGGGLAGLFNAILLNRAGLDVTVVERKTYPFNRVCGEYISNEVIPFLEALNIDVQHLGASTINRLEVTAVFGVKLKQQLDLGGFGISRYRFDNFLYEKAKSAGVIFMLQTRVEDVNFTGDHFEVDVPNQVLTAPLVIGSFGKRSNLDQKLKRNFFYRRSPYLAVKFHLRVNFPDDLIQLNNYHNGYCGISKIEADRHCMCYLAHRDDLRKYGSLPALEEYVIKKNPYLKEVFESAEFLFDRPEVINEISFEKKQPLEGHILMSGDTAGMIAPLCGNGMTMAIHSAKLLSQIIINNYTRNSFTPAKRTIIEQEYQIAWEKQFAQRLWTGRQLQRMFGNNTTTALMLNTLNAISPLTRYLMGKTHGKPFGLA